MEKIFRRCLHFKINKNTFFFSFFSIREIGAHNVDLVYTKNIWRENLSSPFCWNWHKNSIMKLETSHLGRFGIKIGIVKKKNLNFKFFLDKKVEILWKVWQESQNCISF
jgi:hypothetical protein